MICLLWRLFFDSSYSDSKFHQEILSELREFNPHVSALRLVIRYVQEMSKEKLGAIRKDAQQNIEDSCFDISFI